MWIPAINNARAHCQNKNDVFLIYRINDANALTTLYSEPYAEATLPSRIKTYVVKPIVKRKKGEGFMAIGPLENKQMAAIFNIKQSGGHAEEIFIRTLPSIVAAAGQLNKVEMVISRIPCADQSPPWACLEKLEAVNISGSAQPVLPPGCGPKLHEVIKGMPKTSWSIRWIENYTGPAQTACVSIMSQIADLKNAKVGPFTR